MTLHPATDHDAGLPAACCDLVLMVDVYHELSDPPGVVGSIRRALRPPAGSSWSSIAARIRRSSIKPEHKMTLPQIKKELDGLGFHFVESLEMLPDQRVVIFE